MQYEALEVLLVDDSKIARMAAKKALLSIRPTLHVYEAGNADDAAWLAERYRPHLIMLDHNMPGRNGLEAAAEIKSLGLSTLMALVTANTQEQIKSCAAGLGLEFVSKPIQEDALRTLLQKAQDRLDVIAGQTESVAPRKQ